MKRNVRATQCASIALASRQIRRRQIALDDDAFEVLDFVANPVAEHPALRGQEGNDAARASGAADTVPGDDEPEPLADAVAVLWTRGVGGSG